MVTTTTTAQQELKEPTDVLVKKAIYLEETLKKMQDHSNFLYWKIRKLSKQGKNTKELKLKMKDINKGVNEVFEKCNVLWSKIETQAREERR